MKKTNSVFFDTNVYINLLQFPEYSRKTEKFLQGGFLYVINRIVLMELWTGVRTKMEENILTQHEESLPHIGMSDDNFISAGKLLRQMCTEYQFEPKQRRRLTWDVLLALSAKENSALLVTENESDFRKIRKFLEFEFVSVGNV